MNNTPGKKQTITNLKDLSAILEANMDCILSVNTNKRAITPALLYVLHTNGTYDTIIISRPLYNKCFAIGAVWPASYKYILTEPLKELIRIESK
jgi:hypothetical protein